MKALFLIVTIIYSNIGLAMNDNEKAMSEWLAHPMEFNQEPVEIKEIHHELTEWPLADTKVEISFHHYKMKNGYDGIGMTGPITWSFIGDKLQNSFSFDELKRLYAGWYVSFAAINAKNYDPKQNESMKKATLDELQKNNKNIISIEEYLTIGNLVFYAYIEKKGNTEIVIATDTQYPQAYARDSKYLSLPILYYYIGSLFFDGKL